MALRRRRRPTTAYADGPHVRLGVAWALTTLAAAAVGPAALAIVLAPVASLAAAQAARSWRHRQRPAASPLSAGGAGLFVTAAVAGPVAVVGAVTLFAAFLAVASTLALSQARPAPRHASPLLTAAIAIAFGAAGAAPVLLRGDGLLPVFVLLSFVHVYDAGAYLVGTGASELWEGPAAGVASIAAVTLAVAAVLSPPFRGASPWLFGLLAAVLTPLGPVAAAELIGDRPGRMPAVRRLDSLLVVGPVWALAAALALD